VLYVTPARYRTMGFGADIEEVDDSALAMQLRLASSLVNRYCNKPSGYSFLGGLVTDEIHPWRLGNEHAPQGPLGLFPKFKPLLELDSFQIQVTNTQYLDVDTDQVFYSAPQNILMPVIASSSIGIWSYTAIPVAGLPVPQAKLSYSYGFSHDDVAEELFPEGGGLYRAANQWWTDDAVTVYRNGIELTDYTIDRNEGTITLTDPDSMDLDDVITATYTHMLPEDVRDATAVIMTDLAGTTNIVGAGLLGLSRIRAEEIELAVDSKSAISGGEISDRAKMLLDAYRDLSWG
jgi:hypothetical protein